MTDAHRTKEPDLLPCPFCGGPAEWDYDDERHHNEERGEEHRWAVNCAGIDRTCPVGPMTQCTTRETAIEQWNTRAST